MQDAVDLYRQKIHMDHLESIARFKSALSMARTDVETLVGKPQKHRREEEGQKIVKVERMYKKE